MSVKSSRVLRSALCLVLAVLMALGTCVTAFAAESDETIKYVSLGDSMTNGYGLNGYTEENNGYQDEAPEAYPAQVAEHYDWELTQLATSAMRAEDLHYILEYGSENAYPGDEWTRDELLERDSRWGGTHGGAEKVSKVFQEAVTGADVISVAVGNANFGVFLLGRVMNALGVMGGEPEDDAWINFEDALAECTADEKAVVMQAYDALMAAACEYMPVELAEPMVRATAYTMVSYILNYNGVLDAIVELNPDAEIIIVGLMNTLNGMVMTMEYEGENYTIHMADLLGVLIEPMNMYLATLPAVKQAMGEYSEATIYYAEASRVDVLCNTYADSLNDSDNVIRKRFVDNITDFVFPMLPSSLGLTGDITVETVKGYENASESGFATLAGFATGVGASVAASAAAYVGIEGAALGALEEQAPISAFLSLTDLEGAMSGVFEAYEANIAESVAENWDAAVTAIVIPQLQAYYDQNNQNVTVTLEAAKVYLEQEDNAELKATITNLCVLKATPGALEAALLENETTCGLLNVYTRLKLGDGLSAHPSAAGHDTLTNAITSVYEQKVTVDQVVEEKATAALTELVALLKEYGPEYADEAWNYAVEQGYVAAAQEAIDEMLLAAEAELEAFMADPEGYVTAASAELQAQLAALKTALAESEHELADDLLVQIEALETQLADLYAQLETATGEVKVQLEAAITEIENAIAALEAEAAALEADIAAITAEIEAIEADIIALGEQTAAIGEKLVSLVDQAEAMKGSLETLVAEGPEALEENIDAVVTQIETAVETIVTIAGEVEEAVAAAEELAASIDSAIDTVVAAIEARIGSYAETLETIADTLGTGLAPVVEALNALAEGAGELAEEAAAAIAAHEAEIAAILAAAEEAAAAIRAEYAEEIAALELAVAEKKAELETKLAELETAVSEELTARKAELEAQITDLQAQLEAKKAELEGAAEEVKAEIQAAIAEIETAIADAEAALAEVEAEIQAAVAEIEAAIEEIEAAIADAEAALAEKVAEVEAAVSEIIAEAEAKAAELQAEIDELLAEAGEQIDAAVKEAAAALVEEIAKVSEEAAAAVEAALAEGVTGVEALIDEAAAAAAAGAEELVTYVEEQLNTLAETVQAYVDEFAAEIEQAYQNATTGEYEINSANYYVSLGDDSAVSQSFVDELAAELGVDYKNLAAAGTTPEDLLAALAAGDEAYIAEIAKADLITVSYNPATFATTQVEKLTGNQALEEMDWAAYVGEEGTVYVDEALAELDAYLAEAGITGNYADIVSTVVESYAYSVMSFAANYAVMVDAIHEISPNAEVIILGSYNAFNDVEFVMGADVLPLGEGMEALTELANAYLLAYAAIAENTTYVDITDTDTELELSGRMEIDVADPYVLIEVFTMLQNLGGTVTPTADGHTYIKNQILGVETIIEPDGLLGDVTLDGVIDIRDVQALFDHVMGYETLTGIALKNADVNEDGSVNIIDVQALFEIVMTN